MSALLIAFKASRYFAFTMKWGGVLIAVLLALFGLLKWASRTQTRAAQVEIESRVLRQRAQVLKEVENVNAKMQSAGANQPRDRDDLTARLRDESY